MFDFLSPLFMFFLGIFVGFMDSTVGSGGLVLIPSLIFLGLPPQAAIATDRLGSLGQTFGALIKYWNSKKIVWGYIPGFTLLAIAGGFIGANLLLHINPVTLQKIIGIVLLLVLPFVIFKQDAGIKKINTGIFKKIIGHIIYFLIKIYDGLFGTGSGPLTTYNYLLSFGFTILEASATSIIPWLFLSLLSVIIFTKANLINYINSIPLVIGMLVGGYIGAHTLLKIGNTWVKRLFIAIVIISALKLLFF